MNRYDKIYKYVMAVLLLLFIGAIAVLNLLAAEREFSEAENRVLEKWPDFTLQSLAAGKFTSSYEKYVSDQFIFRDAWIGMKTDADRAMGKKESNGVYLGKDGFLIQRFNPPEDRDVEDKIQAIRAFDHATPGVRKYMMLVPTAAIVLQDKLPAYAAAGDESAYVDKVRHALPDGIRFVDVHPALSAEREQPIFYRTDHHWTTTGAYYAYRELCKHMGIIPLDKEDFRIQRVTDQFYGSLYSKSGFRHIRPDGIELYLPKKEAAYKVEYVDEQRTTDSLYELGNLNKKDKYTVFFNGNHALIKITTAHLEGKRKLLVVKDSYANSLLPFLTEHFSEIYVVDLRYYGEDLKALVRQHGIRDMLLLYNVNTFFEDPSIQNLSELIE
ncbi:DHHW family protein [Paenibacillus thiaminolyticus]|uniref:DHHW family protein n=1 Tax=Paenibacillus thiaminolyticus TaxID=49283 RepID=UPI0025428BC7|nr:DHHW family protein [Paenibacillus thiaminolyticus]WII36035.1 DHHW family protein [Paenibacillus thiaminolyticus]